MDKFEQLKKEYDLLESFCRPWLAEPGEFEFYIETAMLRIWSANGKYSDDYAGAIRAISGKDRTAVQITKAMLDSTEPSELVKIPSFFARMVDDDFNAGTSKAKAFVGDLKSLLAGAAFINGDFTIEESNMLSAELKRLMTYSISKGVKVDYSTGRIRQRVTPLKEDSYVSAGTQAEVSAELIFDATNTKGLEYVNKYVKKTGNTSALMYCAIDDPAAFAREAGCELLEVRPFYTAARRILKGKVNLYSKIAMAIADRTGRAFLLHMKL